MANTRANGSTPTSCEPATTSFSNMWNDSASMINRGGLGDGTTHVKPAPPAEVLAYLDSYEAQFYPHQKRSLSGIALRACLLGCSFTIALFLTIYLLCNQSPLWRAPYFVATLSLFHFLEFWTTSFSNTAAANVSSYLLTSNGSAYTAAHTLAITECLLSHFCLPYILPEGLHNALLILGLSLVLLGQTVRSFAMLKAGKNFSHLVRRTRVQEHELVTTGIYSWFRHPSYFGFFWWGIGTQLVCGNTFMLLGYAWALWTFFANRIPGEEKALVSFFGDDYVKYRQRTVVGIPFIK